MKMRAFVSALMAGTAILAVACTTPETQSAAQSLAPETAPVETVAQTVSEAGKPAIVASQKVAPGSLYELVFNPANNSVYVAAVGPRGENKAAIARIDGKTLAPISTVDVSSNPLYGLGLNVSTQTLYGSDTRQGVVSAIDLTKGIITNISIEGEKPHLRQVVVDEAANKVYVSIVGRSRGDTVTPSEVWVIDGATNTLDRIIEVDIDGLTGLAVDSAGKRLFGTGMSSNDVAVVDLTTDETVARWPVGSESAINVAYDAAGQRLFVASQGTGDLTVLSAVDGAVLAKVPTGEGALSVAYNPAVNQAYVANRRAGTVSVVDAGDYSVIANLESGTFPQTIAIDPATNLVYVTNKARGLPRDAEPGTPVPEDPAGDTVTIIRPN